ncbi:hypothetical protein [Streptosporangium sp. NPDC051022]|uniref:hypothetical protein n=1 Tax=Streptosporangium sp. NPDC051022 TaxID=3155752 RepID=UPI003432A3D1
MKSVPKAKRVTVVIETEDGIGAWQAEYPEDMTFDFNVEDPSQDPYVGAWHLQRSPKCRFGVDVDCGENGLVAATTVEAVNGLLARIGKAPASPEEAR